LRFRIPILSAALLAPPAVVSGNITQQSGASFDGSAKMVPIAGIEQRYRPFTT
jgi:hypothetical protein